MLNLRRHGPMVCDGLDLWMAGPMATGPGLKTCVTSPEPDWKDATMRFKKCLSAFTLVAVTATVCFSNTLSAVADGHVHAGDNRHVKWCYAHFRSYREWDNSFQPRHGPRRECISPFGTDRDVARHDQFGNLPELFPGGEIFADGNEAPRDRFGNLPEMLDNGSGANTTLGRDQPSPDTIETPAPSAESPASRDNVDVEAGVAHDTTGEPAEGAEPAASQTTEKAEEP